MASPIGSAEWVQGQRAFLASYREYPKDTDAIGSRCGNNVARRGGYYVRFRAYPEDEHSDGWPPSPTSHCDHAGA